MIKLAVITLPIFEIDIETKTEIEIFSGSRYWWNINSVVEGDELVLPD